MASNTTIQCSSSSSHVMRTYDVFVSFRGEDTRNNFTGFLFQALHKKGIDAFKDDRDLKKGESIGPELLQAIEGSHIFLVVFSKNYASSTWCLRELAKICNCIDTSRRRVLPVFYDVDPSQVRKQSGYYEKAFAEHEERFREYKEKMEEVQRWREALTQVANLSGWDVGNKPQYAKIEEIVDQIINILGHKFSSLPNHHLVGMESRIEELGNLLCLGSVNDVRLVGISGMGGIGKTTLVRALYERISHQYDFCCFIDDVSKIYRDSSTLGVQKQILSQSLNEKNIEICNVSEGTYLVWTRLRNARALIVIDNVYQVEQLKMFTGSRDTLLRECLGGGSRIIIISRDKSILRTHGVDDVYQVQPLNDNDSVRLFCKNAFKGNYIMSDYEELTCDVLLHARGHPLAIEVLGSSLYGRNVSQWRSALARLKINKNKNIMDVLRLSFDELDDIDKEIFLDIACFFSFSNEQYVKKILDFRGFHPEYGLEILVDKSLITIQEGMIRMHGLLKDLGRCIVQEKSPKEPRKWSRLWDYHDLHKVMSDNMAAENLEAILIGYQVSGLPETTMRADALSKMSHLKLLSFQNLNFSGSLNYLSNELGYLHWNKYPFECLPPCFEPDKLVELLLPNSNIKQLWEGTKPLHNLRILDLSHSKNLIKTPNFGEARYLETLNLEGCIHLRQIDPSIGLMRKLSVLNLKDCKNLVSLPNSILGLISLEYLSLSGCSKLYNIQLLDKPWDAEPLKKLCIGETPIHSQSTLSIVKRWFMWPLHLLYSRADKNSVSYLLPSSPTFLCMHQLDLSFCNLLQIPDAIGNLRCLERLILRGNNFNTLPSLKELSKLYYLNSQDCKQMKYLPELPSQTDLPSQYYTSPWPIINPLDDGRVAGLSIFNCPELVERECCTSMSFSWMLQIVQAVHQCKCLEYAPLTPNIESIVPGSEIPRWFNNQHVGMDSLISIEASPLMQHVNNWLGIACCVVFVVRHKRTGVLVMDPPKTNALEVNISVDLEGDLVTDESDHMWLFYFTRPHFIDSCKFWAIPDPDDLKWTFYIRDKRDFHFEVKRYGYRWVYEQDLELSNLTMMHSRNSLLRKRKFLAVEENK